MNDEVGKNIKMANVDGNELKRVNYEIFILILTVLSVFNLFLILIDFDDDTVQVVSQVNLLLSLIFMMDFLYRLYSAEVRKDYFFKQYGWLDFLGGLPFPITNLARLMRLFRASRGLRKLGGKEVLRQVANNRADSVLISVGLCVILLLEFGSIFILKAEANQIGSNINSSEEALWWVLVTISTVGYGDYFPVTRTGRFVAIFVIIAGVGVFGTLSGFLTNSFLGQKEDDTVQGDRSIDDQILAELKRLQLEYKENRLAITEIKQEQVSTNTEILARLESLERLLQSSPND